MADRTSTVRVNVITDASGAGAMLGKFGRVAGVAALGVGALAVGAVVGADKLATFADVSDDANVKIENVVKTMKIGGTESQKYAKAIQDTAKQVSLATGVDINSIKATQAKLLTFKALGKNVEEINGQFNRATRAAIDMAALGFGTAETNAVQLGKALQDPATGLTALKKTGALTADQVKRIGDEFKRTGDIGTAQNQVLAAVEEQVKGTAEATAGGFEKMKNAASIWAQELALKALPALDAFGTFMIEKGGPAITQFASQMADKLGPAFRSIGEFLVDKGIPAFVKFAGFIEERVIPVIGSLIGWIGEHLVPMYKTILAGALEGAKGLFANVADSIDKNREPLKDMGEKLKKVGEFLVDKVLPVLGKFYETALPALGTAIGFAITSITNIYNAISSIVTIVQSAIDKVQALITKLGQIKDAVPDIDLPIVGRFVGAGSSSSAGGVSSTGLPTKGSGGVQVIIERALVGDEVFLASEIERVLSAQGLRLTGGT